MYKLREYNCKHYRYTLKTFNRSNVPTCCVCLAQKRPTLGLKRNEVDNLTVYKLTIYRNASVKHPPRISAPSNKHPP